MSSEGGERFLIQVNFFQNGVKVLSSSRVGIEDVNQLLNTAFTVTGNTGRYSFDCPEHPVLKDIDSIIPAVYVFFQQHIGTRFSCNFIGGSNFLVRHKARGDRYASVLVCRFDHHGVTHLSCLCNSLLAGSWKRLGWYRQASLLQYAGSYVFIASQKC